jgi:uncharacterized phage-associated protein
MSAYPAIEVARWILYEAETQGISLFHMQLQKLLYYAQGYLLGMSGNILFNDKIEAWRHGPVVPSVYAAYQQYGGKTITPPSDVLVPEELQGLISAVVQEKGYMGADQLSDATHSEPPYQGTDIGHVITPKKMETHFTTLFWCSDEEDEYEPSFDTIEEEKRYFLENLSAEERNAILSVSR